nr:hypothetical protein [Tanacetum cinerariifolium]
NGVITIYLELDRFLHNSKETKKFEADWELILDGIDFRDIPDIKKVKLLLFHFVDKKKLDGEIKKEEQDAVKRFIGEALKEKEDPGAFVIPIRLEFKINLNALADTGSNINVITFCIYATWGRKEVKPMNRGITMLNHSKSKLLKDMLCQVGVTTIIAKFLFLDMHVDKEVPILVGRGFLVTCGSILNTRNRVTSTFDGIFHHTFRAAETSVNTKENDSEDEVEYSIKRNSFGAPIYRPSSLRYLNCKDPMDHALAL